MILYFQYLVSHVGQFDRYNKKWYSIVQLRGNIMDTKEAKTLVNSTLKTYKLEKRRETVHVVGPIAGLLVGSNLITLAITIPATNEYNPDYKLKEKIDMLKQLKNELKNGVNRFENIDVSNFNNELENQFKKVK